MWVQRNQELGGWVRPWLGLSPCCQLWSQRWAQSSTRLWRPQWGWFHCLSQRFPAQFHFICMCTEPQIQPVTSSSWKMTTNSKVFSYNSYSSFNVLFFSLCPIQIPWLIYYHFSSHWQPQSCWLISTTASLFPFYKYCISFHCFL